MTEVLPKLATERMASNNDVYEPRRSNRIKDSDTTADGDTWEEKLVVCEAASKKLVIRSYFRNARTGKRNWDEPPTGASRIEPASASARHDAQQELSNLQLAMDNGPGGKKASKKGKGFFSAFRKKPKDKDGSSAAAAFGMFGGKKNKKSSPARKEKEPFDGDGDEDMQRAISLSMGLETPVKSDKKPLKMSAQWKEDQEALDMAKAISMSEAQSGGAQPGTGMISEEEMLERAIQASRQESNNGVAAMPDFLGFSEDFSESLSPPELTFSGKTDYDSDFFNQKMPAQPNLKSPPTTTMPASNMKPPPPQAGTTQTANLKSPPPQPSSWAPAPIGASIKQAPPPAQFSFDPYAKNSAPVATTTGTSAQAEMPISNLYSNPMGKTDGVQMVGDVGQRKPAKGIARRIYNKKSVQDAAGVV